MFKLHALAWAKETKPGYRPEQTLAALLEIEEAEVKDWKQSVPLNHAFMLSIYSTGAVTIYFKLYPELRHRLMDLFNLDEETVEDMEMIGSANMTFRYKPDESKGVEL